MSSKILVTGGAGYLGSILVPALLHEGHAVTILDNFMYRQNSLTDCCANDRFEVIRGDCREKETLSKAIEGADYIIPLAAIVGAPACDADPTAAVTTNLEAIKLLLDLRSPSQRILFPCSNSGYGVGEPGKFCTEKSPMRPLTLYGRTKVEAERAVLDAGNSLTFRLATVFGISPRMRMDLLVNDFVYRSLTDRAVIVFEGHAKRNYVHIRDIARAFIHAIRNFETMQGGPYNLGLSNANLSKLELCAKIKEQVPDFVYLQAEIGEDPDKRDYIVSNEKIERTGFQTKYSLEQGISELLKGYRILRNTRYGNI